MKNKKNIIIIIVSILVLIVLFLLYLNYTVVFKLNGDVHMVISYGTPFVDPGYIAKTGFGKDLSSMVTVTGQVELSISGDYEIIYELKHNNKTKKLSRTVTVDKISVDALDIVLNGDETIYLLKDSEYREAGAYIINSISNEKFELGTLEISNNIDNQKIGKYSVEYTYKYGNRTISKTRIVEVVDISHSISPTTLTTNKVNITLNLEKLENYSNTKLPDGKITLYKDIQYEVNKSGDYLFVITLSNNSKIEKVVTVNNIVEDYKCTGTITDSGTSISVTPTIGNVKNYEWVVKNKVTNGSNVYNEYKIINNAQVNVVFESGEKFPVNCVIEDKLLYHFKYDLENSGTWLKPEMQCDTYTANDKIKYDAVLKEVVTKGGGSGSRGGTVEAIRYLIGGLDYRIRYQAPRQTDSSLGKYQKEGLNIGNSKAWGCRVGGYRNGFDCTHFVEWALAQTGFKKGAYSYPTTETSKVIDKIKPGDLLYVRGKSGGLSHVAILAGINDDRSVFYVAESVPGNADVGVTLHVTNRETVLGTYTLVGNVPYTKEGNYNNMWLME